MILSGKEIKKRIYDPCNRDIIIEPFDESQINPNSYNVKLHNELKVYESHVLDMKNPTNTRIIEIPEYGLMLEPNKLYLGRTVEYTETKNLAPQLSGRSSIGRLGISIHVTAGFGDVGFNGYWTLELFCIQPVIIYPFVKIGQLWYQTIEGEYEGYNGKYQNNKETQASMLSEEL